MADKMTKEQRSKCMSRIRGKDTGPEMIVRRWLWQRGYRYRKHEKRLPGTPDIVMRKYGIVIFICRRPTLTSGARRLSETKPATPARKRSFSLWDGAC